VSDSSASEDRQGRPWLVFVVAITGLLSTVGAAGLGGYWADKSVQTSLSEQRSAQIRDQSRAADVAFLKSATALCAYLSSTSQPDAATVNKLATDVYADQASVLLLAGPHVPDPLDNLAKFVIDSINSKERVCATDPYNTLRNAFVAAGKQDLGTGP
jgi:hypothetical protein